jgi:GAF domain-containing protein
MDPLPEVHAQLQRLSSLLGSGTDVGAYLSAVAQVAQALIPSCVGVSITLIIDGDPYTVTATTPEAAVVDASQNVDGGPCLEAVRDGRTVEVEDVLAEEQWHLFAQAGAARGIRSSLSFPIRDLEDMVAGGMNLYASEPGAFRDRRLIPGAFGAELSEVVTNADLAFRTRDFARELPDRLATRERFDLAVSIMIERRGWAPDEAVSRLAKASELAGVPKGTVAEIVIALGTNPAPD